MAGFVVKGRLFAQAILFLVSVLLADTAKALRAPLYEEVIVPPPMLSTLVMLFGYIVGLVFSVKIVNAVVGRYRQNQPLQMRRFTIVMVSAACFMTMPFMIDVMECFPRDFLFNYPAADCNGHYYWALVYNIGCGLVWSAPLLLVSWWLYCYVPPLKSWRFAMVGVVVASALGLLYQYDRNVFLLIIIYVAVVLVLAFVSYCLRCYFSQRWKMLF